MVSVAISNGTLNIQETGLNNINVGNGSFQTEDYLFEEVNVTNSTDEDVLDYLEKEPSVENKKLPIANYTPVYTKWNFTTLEEILPPIKKPSSEQRN